MTTTEISEEELQGLKKLKKLLDSSSSSGDMILPTDETALNVLNQKVSKFLDNSKTIKVGDIVRWKKGLKNRKYPKENQLCKVIEVIEKPIIQDARDSGSPYYREPLDLILALLDDNSDLVLYHYDKRRFERVE